MAASRAQRWFHFLCVVSLLTTGLMHGFIDGPRSLLWRLTQIGSWSLLTNLVFFGSAFMQNLKRDSERTSDMPIILHDIAFTVCLSISVGVFAFYVLVVVPFTPEFTIDPNCKNTRNEDDCTSVAGLLVLSMVHLVPFVAMTLEMIYIEHRFAFENKRVELFFLISYVVIFLIWSVLCFEFLHASPYYVQDKIGKNSSIIIYVLCVGFFVATFFTVRWIHHRLWPPITKLHYTDQLLRSIEADWNSVPDAEEFEFKVQTYGTNDVDGDDELMGDVLHATGPQVESDRGHHIDDVKIVDTEI
mmetsp:Transcript_17308/g.31058  ORF Transcript_17308/g.31058 Transcript_17308/m.31058 type:complete len:301 (+) Transcript_17308:112-1014(+)